MPDRPLAHIADRALWEAALRDGAPYAPPSLEAEGFIHCSFSEQLESTLSRYYADDPEVLLLWLDRAAITAAGLEIVVEDTSGHGAFPHLYGALPIDGVARQEIRRRPSVGWADRAR